MSSSPPKIEQYNFLTISVVETLKKMGKFLLIIENKHKYKLGRTIYDIENNEYKIIGTQFKNGKCNLYVKKLGKKDPKPGLYKQR